MEQSRCEPCRKRRRRGSVNKLGLREAIETPVTTERGTSVDFCLVSSPMKALQGSQPALDWEAPRSGGTA